MSQPRHQPGQSASGVEPGLAELLDPAGLERRLADARLRRAEALAKRAALKEAEPAEVASPEPLPPTRRPALAERPPAPVFERASPLRPRLQEPRVARLELRPAGPTPVPVPELSVSALPVVVDQPGPPWRHAALLMLASGFALGLFVASVILVTRPALVREWLQPAPSGPAPVVATEIGVPNAGAPTGPAPVVATPAAEAPAEVAALPAAPEAEPAPVAEEEPADLPAAAPHVAAFPAGPGRFPVEMGATDLGLPVPDAAVPAEDPVGPAIAAGQAARLAGGAAPRAELPAVQAPRMRDLRAGGIATPLERTLALDPAGRLAALPAELAGAPTAVAVPAGAPHALAPLPAMHAPGAGELVRSVAIPPGTGPRLRFTTAAPPDGGVREALAFPGSDGSLPVSASYTLPESEPPSVPTASPTVRSAPARAAAPVRAAPKPVATRPAAPAPTVVRQAPASPRVSQRAVEGMLRDRLLGK